MKKMKHEKMQHEKIAIRNIYNIKRVQHEPLRKERNMKKCATHENSAMRTNLQHEKRVTPIKVQHEKTLT